MSSALSGTIGQSEFTDRGPGYRAPQV
jgi:hypothetical protein